MAIRIVMIDLFEKEIVKKVVVSEITETYASKKKVKTLPYLSTEERIAEGLQPRFLELEGIEPKSVEEKLLLKKLRRSVSNRSPRQVVKLADIRL